MKKVLLGSITLFVAFWAGQAFEARRLDNQIQMERAEKLSEVSTMTNYLLDVVDETDFWDEVDSTKLGVYEEDSPEWMLNVIIEYTKWSNTK